MQERFQDFTGGEKLVYSESEPRLFFAEQKRYYQSILNENDNVSSVRILGSYGRGDARNDSDLDTWITARDGTPFEVLYALWRQDLNTRERYQLDHNNSLSQITRHGPSIFTDSETSAYLAGFIHRVAIPGAIGEQLFIKREGEFSDPIFFSNEDKVADMVITLADFVVNYHREVENADQSLQKKWLKRIYRDVTHYTQGVRLVHDSDIADKNILNEQVISEANNLIETLSQLVDPSLIEERRMIQSCLWTIEKVRWELFSCFEDSKRWDRWRTGERVHLGFTPEQIGELLRTCQQYLGESSPSTKRVGSLLVEIANPSAMYTHERIVALHDELSSVLYEMISALSFSVRTSNKGETTVWPVSDGKSRLIRRTATSHAQHYLQTELAAHRLIDENRIHSIEVNKEGALTSVSLKAVAGIPMLQSPEAINTDTYLKVVTDNHTIEGDYFGRLEAPIKFESYEDYLMFMTAGLPDSLRLFIQKQIQESREAIATERAVFCHMDPGPHNVVVDRGIYHLVDYEHATFCSPIWDIERLAVDLEKSQRDAFLVQYYTQHPEHGDAAIFATRATIAARLLEIPRYTIRSMETLRSLGY